MMEVCSGQKRSIRDVWRRKRAAEKIETGENENEMKEIMSMTGVEIGSGYPTNENLIIWLKTQELNHYFMQIKILVCALCHQYG
jgi:ribonuclease HII